MDTCPDEPGGSRARHRACNGCKPKDRDNDGIPDMWDACPDDPGGASPDMRAHGCKPKDSDADGIPDTLDACPLVAGVKTDDPKTNGCPNRGPRRRWQFRTTSTHAPMSRAKRIPIRRRTAAPRPSSRKARSTSREQVEFKTGSAALAADAGTARILDAVLDVLQKHPEIKKVRVEGHTDNQGTAANNKTLSAQRADTVVKWLSGKGIDKSRLSSQGFGQEKPIADNKTAEGRKINRRVEFHIE